MTVEVFFHKRTFSEFFEPVDLKHPGLSSTLKSEFTRYVESDRVMLPSIFGKDDCYMQPPQAAQACLMHIHIKIPPAYFPKNLPRHQRKCAKGRPGEDAALFMSQASWRKTAFYYWLFSGLMHTPKAATAQRCDI
jgi:mRNA interferase YafO